MMMLFLLLMTSLTIKLIVMDGLSGGCNMIRSKVKVYKLCKPRTAALCSSKKPQECKNMPLVLLLLLVMNQTFGLKVLLSGEVKVENHKK